MEILEDGPLKVQKIRMYPNQEQKEKLLMDGKLVIYKNNFETQNQWVTETPDGIRDEALNELLIAYNTNLKQEKRFEIKSKARKNGKDSITIKARDFTDKEANIFHF
ncbi:27957_t:CDS:2 [Dentiscutata erythropus]|uniref:27957_t:CDS:1 n=1 Tax=Dentiscutata erythropus TaxID=1348616 RepID=A0A9N9P3U9_9GLOM|nr:27957_t:CDS:2 [Dentiscutata erythropus]